MCKAFSCVVKRNGECIWEAGIDGHDELISKYKVRDDTIDMEEISNAKVEIIPNQKRKYPYLYPDSKWDLIIDEKVTPSWLKEKDIDSAWLA